MTGTYGFRHGLRSNTHRLHSSNRTLAEVLAEHGYRTGAVIGSFPLDSMYGLDQGFEVYDDEYTVPGIRSYRGYNIEDDEVTQTTPESHSKGLKSDMQVSESAIRLVRSFGEDPDPFFLWAHYFGPHSISFHDLDYWENLRVRVADYSRKVIRTDNAIKHLLAFLDEKGLAENTLLILHADHVESLGEHGFIGHGRYLYENNLRIPLIMRWPSRLRGGVRNAALVGNVDIAPTVLEAAGIDTSSLNMDGHSLLESAQSGERVRDKLYIETYMPAHELFAEPVDEDGSHRVGVRRYGVINQDRKYIVTEPHPLFDNPGMVYSDEVAERFLGTELYDFAHDPGELRNLVETEPEAIERYQMQLNRLLTTAEAPAATEVLPQTPQHLDQLRALGYVE